MSPQFAAQREADDFARAVDGSASPSLARKYADLLDTVHSLQAHPGPTPRPDFVRGLRSELLAAADEYLLPVAPEPTDLEERRRRRRHRRERRLATAAAAIALIGGSTGVAVAAQGALPGNPLYPVKIGLEQVQTNLSTSPTGQAKDELTQAQTRLDEVAGLIKKPGTSPTLVRSTLADFRSSASQGAALMFQSYQSNGDAGDIGAVHRFVSGQMRELTSLSSKAPSTLTAAFANSASTLADLDQQAQVLCSGCAGSPVTVPQALVTTSSVPALQQLVTAPTQRAQKAVQLVKQAQKSAAARTPSSPAAGQQPPQAGAPSLSHPKLPSLPSASQTATTTTNTVGGTVTTVTGKHPVRQLLNGLTGQSSDTSNSGGGALTGITDPLTKTVNGLLGGGQ